MKNVNLEYQEVNIVDGSFFLIQGDRFIFFNEKGIHTIGLSNNLLNFETKWIEADLVPSDYEISNFKHKVVFGDQTLVKRTTSGNYLVSYPSGEEAYVSPEGVILTNWTWNQWENQWEGFLPFVIPELRDNKFIPTREQIMEDHNNNK